MSFSVSDDLIKSVTGSASAELTGRVQPVFVSFSVSDEMILIITDLKISNAKISKTY